MKRRLSILLLGLVTCGISAFAQGETTVPLEEMKFHKLEKLFVVGNFDGNGIDTLFQYNYSRLTRTEIDSSASPYQNDWETVVKWFFEQDANVYLAFNKYNKDTLHLGTAQGLYCLINIGDINSDGKDEIALVIDYLDFSNLNSCKIYTLCNDKWTLLKQFEINELAFEFYDGKVLDFYEIRGYLEKHNGKWFYLGVLDYIDAETDELEMKPLNFEKCR